MKRVWKKNLLILMIILTLFLPNTLRFNCNADLDEIIINDFNSFNIFNNSTFISSIKNSSKAIFEYNDDQTGIERIKEYYLLNLSDSGDWKDFSINVTIAFSYSGIRMGGCSLDLLSNYYENGTKVNATSKIFDQISFVGAYDNSDTLDVHGTVGVNIDDSFVEYYSEDFPYRNNISLSITRTSGSILNCTISCEDVLIINKLFSAGVTRPLNGIRMGIYLVPSFTNYYHAEFTNFNLHLINKYVTFQPETPIGQLIGNSIYIIVFTLIFVFLITIFIVDIFVSKKFKS